MKIGPVLALQVGLALVGLVIYHLARPVPAAGTAFDGRRSGLPGAAPAGREPGPESDDVDRRLAALETGVYQVRRGLEDVQLVARSGASREQVLSEDRLAVLEKQVGVVEARQLEERMTANLRVGVRELRLSLSPAEERAVVDLIKRSNLELAAFGKKLRDEKIFDRQKNLEGYDAIRKRYHDELRRLLAKEQAEALIQRFFALR